MTSKTKNNKQKYTTFTTYGHDFVLENINVFVSLLKY